MPHYISYGLLAFAAATYFAVFGFGPFAAWDCIRRMPKNEKKRKGRSEVDEEESSNR
jgi:hypothetical protein